MNAAALDEEASRVFNRLLDRMRGKGDFPALSGTIARIQGISSSENESLATLTNEILKDVALTHRLLRLVNTVNYARGDTIRTVSRAVSLVGFNGIRNLTLSLVLLEHMEDKAHAGLIRDEFMRSLLAASIARELAGGTHEAGEEAFLGAMFQNLGRLLIEYYFPQEAQAIRSLRAGEPPLTEAVAAVRVLGISFEQLGLGMARVWNLPDIIQRCIRKPAGAPPTVPLASLEERLRWMALVANDASDQLLQGDPKKVPGELARISSLHARCMDLSTREVDKAIQRARGKLGELAKIMDLRVDPNSSVGKLMQASSAQEDAAAAQAEDSEGPVSELHESDEAPSETGLGPDAIARQRSIHMLLSGVHDLTNAMLDEFKLSDVLRMILETMYRAMVFDRVIFCMRDAKADALTGRFGLGEGVEGMVKCFNIPLRETSGDLFATISAKGADTLITDTRDPRIQERLPAWYRASFAPPTFLLLPLVHKGSTFGLIYADKSGEHTVQIDDQQLALLRTLRNQAVMAFRQSI